MGLVGSIASRKAITRLLAEFSNFERPEQVPRSSTGIQTCVVMYRRASCVSRSQKREKRPTDAGEQRTNVSKKGTRYLVLDNIKLHAGAIITEYSCQV